jgi:peptidoglycan/xylan/chitin deacetylase (PgdA/CDA1 family)
MFNFAEITRCQRFPSGSNSTTGVLMETRLCAHAAAEYIRRHSRLERIGKAVVPIAGEFLYLNRILTIRRRHGPLVLCYHGVVPDEIAEDRQSFGNIVSLSEFSEQMSFLSRTMIPITLSALNSWLHGGSALPDNSVLVTFDDGYRNNVTHAVPILRKFEIPAVIFVTVSYIGTDRLLWPTEIYRCVLLWPSPPVPLPDGSIINVPPNDSQKRTALAKWTREFCKLLSEEQRNQYLLSLREAGFPPLTDNEMEMFSFLSWEETNRLHQMGFAVGSHTMDHCILTQIPADRLRRELEASREKLEMNLKTSCISIAYPNGGAADCSPQVLSAAAQANYELGFTTGPSGCTRHSNPLAVDRICIPGKISRLGYQSRISGLHDWLRNSLSQRLWNETLG